jgi:hypothetical protein
MKSLAHSRGPIHLGLDVHNLSITAGILEPAASTCSRTTSHVARGTGSRARCR